MSKYTLEDVAKVLDINTDTVKNMARQRILPFVVPTNLDKDYRNYVVLDGLFEMYTMSYGENVARMPADLLEFVRWKRGECQ